jgi:hypothetical protein
LKRRVDLRRRLESVAVISLQFAESTMYSRDGIYFDMDGTYADWDAKSILGVLDGSEKFRGGDGGGRGGTVF